jgi:hypothetical protein
MTTHGDAMCCGGACNGHGFMCCGGACNEHGFKYHENVSVIMKIDKTWFTENRSVTI